MVSARPQTAKTGERREKIFLSFLFTGGKKEMKENGIIRRIGAIFDGPQLGRVSTLCAARVHEDKIDTFVQTVNTNKNKNYRKNKQLTAE